MPRPRAYLRPSSRRSTGWLGTRVGALTLVLLLLVVLLPACSDRLEQARAAEQAGQLQTAIRLYEEQLQEHPDDLQALEGIAVDLYLGGDFDGALPYQEKVVALDPGNVQTRVELGFNYLNHQNEPQRAATVMAEAAELEPSAKVFTFLAQADIGAGMVDKAEEVLRRAIAAEPAYAHSYVVLIALLEEQGRGDEAAEVRAAADTAGVKLEE
jgi:tetratricopeptide (TPR) repeat protein